jgi:hypothetical protein
MKSAGSVIGERIIDELFILNQNKYDEWIQSSVNIKGLSSSSSKNDVSIYSCIHIISMH